MTRELKKINSKKLENVQFRVISFIDLYRIRLMTQEEQFLITSQDTLNLEYDQQVIIL